MDRRTFLKKTAKSTLGLLAVSVVPMSLTGCNKDTVDLSSMAKLGPLSELQKGPFPKKVDYAITIKDAWVEQENKGFVYVNYDEKTDELLIMSPICTHLGCTAGIATEKQRTEGISFHCKCHDGKYDDLGINIAGPPPRPLDIFKPVIENDEVYIPIFDAQKREA
ncbi:Rieske 2Fe-2S domain-containing protein [Bacillus aquiflavi]|uniref:QcrA and Rieske domain-containing protein n=1 Tax=Bacillus aquiflavi TaxID=2672567 RepID=UPI001CA9F8AF|nr:Rieske 2Fe-2S domain-containing protein [Bacillus aquiflavi]UAC48388.1 Rieske 2Fe-2S domain-containing protein [Bacillus aquiflavi]